MLFQGIHQEHSCSAGVKVILSKFKKKWDFLEVWIDGCSDSSYLPYILLLIKTNFNEYIIYDPQENYELEYMADTYQDDIDGAMWFLLEDEYIKLQGNILWDDVYSLDRSDRIIDIELVQDIRYLVNIMGDSLKPIGYHPKESYQDNYDISKKTLGFSKKSEIKGWQKLEAWIYPFVYPPYILIVLLKISGIYSIRDPSQSDFALFESADYNEIAKRLREDDYLRITGEIGINEDNEPTIIELS
jgi:hypothetical protein